MLQLHQLWFQILKQEYIPSPKSKMPSQSQTHELQVKWLWSQAWMTREGFSLTEWDQSYLDYVKVSTMLLSKITMICSYLCVPIPITAPPSGLLTTLAAYSPPSNSLISPWWTGGGSSTPSSGFVTNSYVENFSSWDRANISVSLRKLAWCIEAPWLMVWWSASSSSAMVVL